MPPPFADDKLYGVNPDLSMKIQGFLQALPVGKGAVFVVGIAGHLADDLDLRRQTDRICPVGKENGAVIGEGIDIQLHAPAAILEAVFELAHTPETQIRFHEIGHIVLLGNGPLGHPAGTVLADTLGGVEKELVVERRLLADTPLDLL